MNLREEGRVTWVAERLQMELGGRVENALAAEEKNAHAIIGIRGYWAVRDIPDDEPDHLGGGK